MKWKKMMSLLVGTCMCAALLAGCGNSGDGNSGAGNQSAGSGETQGTEGSEEGAVEDGAGEEENGEAANVEAADKIVIFQSKVEIRDELEELAKEYQQATGVEVEVWGTTGDDYFQQLKTKLANNQGPTIFNLAPGSESEQMKAYLADLDDLSFIGDVADGMVDEADGRKVGIPYTVEGFGVVYNKDMVDMSQVTDYDSFVQMMIDQKADGVNGFGLSQESYFMIGHILNTPFALQEDPQQFVADLISGDVKLSEVPEFVEFADLYAAIREHSYNPMSVSYDKECGDLATGLTASIHQGNWCISMFDDYEIDFEMGMAALPLAGNDKLAVSVPSAWYINSQASPEEIRAGKDFLEWLYTSETGERYLMDEFRFIPVVAGMENENLDVLSQEVARFTEEGKTISWPMTEWPAGMVDVYLVPVAEEFFTTDMTAEAFLQALEDAFVEAGAN